MRAIAEHGPDVTTERIAEAAGVARAQIYRHFDDATDLQRAIADRATQAITAALRPVWEPQGSALQMIFVAVDAHTGWVAANGELYRYLMRHSQIGRSAGQDAIVDVKTIIARQLTQVFEFYLNAFELDARIADVLSFGVVGLVDSSVTQWLNSPQGIDRPQLTDMLTRWVWHILNDSLRAAGIEIDPDLPLPPPPPATPPA
ncbi:DNA-binding transcriptional regulator, AcrR family [Amycolatopsis xylanica]|uniref:DNA-binding transcriptional regulator, AcrR family n=1 Tax=Amycolatopsis xylanica TaxID=589385 RepID=A0A1H3SBW9_9PSEU|nr:DNA-binding transcriptional regulator, AcrR family [Amycolatopsis xylanica]